MSLDKLKILNDLVSLMNQLQSPECGCMGNMFSKSGIEQNKEAPAYGWQYQQGWGNQACGGRPSFRVPYATNQQSMPMQGNRCMNCCKLARFFADTYGYLNQNLMQPVVREVYEDLKSIKPANAVMYSPMGNQITLGQGSQNAIRNIEGQNPMGGNMGGIRAGNAMTAMPMGQQQHNPMTAMPMGQQQHYPMTAMPMGHHQQNLMTAMLMCRQKQNPMTAMPMGRQQYNPMTAMPMGQHHHNPMTAMPMAQQQQNPMTAMPMGQQQQNPMTAMPMGQQQQNPMTAMPMGQQQQDPMGGMGAQIMNMMTAGKSRTRHGGEQPSEGCKVKVFDYLLL